MKSPYYVCVKLDIPYSKLLNSEYDHRGITIKTDYEVSYWTPRTGIVVSVPESLSDMAWETKVEIQPGQRIWFEYLDALMALGKLGNPGGIDIPRWRKEGDSVLVFIRYDSIVMAEKDGEYYTVNGYVVLKPIKHKVESSLILDDYENMECKVMCLGSEVTGHIDGSEDASGISVGDTVIIKKFKIKLENDFANIFGKGCIYLQRKNIYAKIS